MSEWWTYRPADFLMFAPRTYWRLFELHNSAWWPAQPLFLLVALALGVWFLRCGATALRAGLLALAVGLAFSAWGFVWLRYQPINWAASGLAAGLAVLAVVLLVLCTRRDLAATPHGRRRGVGLGLIAWATLAHPLLAPAFGRPWVQAEVIGLAPDPTLIAVLGAALLVQVDAAGALTRWLLRAVRLLAVAACAVSVATLWTLGSPQGAVPAVATVLALGFTRWPRQPEGAVRRPASQPAGF